MNQYFRHIVVFLYITMAISSYLFIANSRPACLYMFTVCASLSARLFLQNHTLFIRMPIMLERHAQSILYKQPARPLGAAKK